VEFLGTFGNSTPCNSLELLETPGNSEEPLGALNYLKLRNSKDPLGAFNSLELLGVPNSLELLGVPRNLWEL
jgi:hypothetical protein